jgi:hypothetical protein
MSARIRGDGDDIVVSDSGSGHGGLRGKCFDPVYLEVGHVADVDEPLPAIGRVLVSAGLIGWPSPS